MSDHDDSVAAAAAVHQPSDTPSLAEQVPSAQEAVDALKTGATSLVTGIANLVLGLGDANWDNARVHSDADKVDEIEELHVPGSYQDVTSDRDNTEVVSAGLHSAYGTLPSINQATLSSPDTEHIESHDPTFQPLNFEQARQPFSETDQIQSRASPLPLTTADEISIERGPELFSETEKILNHVPSLPHTTADGINIGRVSGVFSKTGQTQNHVAPLPSKTTQNLFTEQAQQNAPNMHDEQTEEDMQDVELLDGQKENPQQGIPAQDQQGTPYTEEQVPDQRSSANTVTEQVRNAARSAQKQVRNAACSAQKQVQQGFQFVNEQLPGQQYLVADSLQSSVQEQGDDHHHSERDQLQQGIEAVRQGDIVKAQTLSQPSEAKESQDQVSAQSADAQKIPQNGIAFVSNQLQDRADIIADRIPLVSDPVLDVAKSQGQAGGAAPLGQSPFEAIAVPSVVAQSQREAGDFPEISSNLGAVLVKKEVEQEIQRQVPKLTSSVGTGMSHTDANDAAYAIVVNDLDGVDLHSGVKNGVIGAGSSRPLEIPDYGVQSMISHQVRPETSASLPADAHLPSLQYVDLSAGVKNGVVGAGAAHGTE